MKSPIRRPRPILDSYDTDYIELPQHPEIERIVVEPLKTIYTNLSAAPDANIIRVVRNMDDPLLHYT